MYTTMLFAVEEVEWRVAATGDRRRRRDVSHGEEEGTRDAGASDQPARVR